MQPFLVSCGQHAWHCFLIEKFSLFFNQFVIFAVVAISLCQKLITFKPFCFPLSAVKCSSKMLSLSLILHLVPPSICSFPKNPHQSHHFPKKNPLKTTTTEKNKGKKKLTEKGLLFTPYPQHVLLLGCLRSFSGDLSDCK